MQDPKSKIFFFAYTRAKGNDGLDAPTFIPSQVNENQAIYQTSTNPYSDTMLEGLNIKAPSPIRSPTGAGTKGNLATLTANPYTKGAYNLHKTLTYGSSHLQIHMLSRITLQVHICH
jgi:hypothetical protein